jgi:predicted TIM-barrel fold metal-dependent hydrolase
LSGALPLLFLLVLQAPAEERLPIIDMHLHASPADDQGPPPLAMCTPIDPFPAWDPASLGRDTASPDALRALRAEGRLAVLAEVTNQHAGIAPDDARMEPYWALAEELDIPPRAAFYRYLRGIVEAGFGKRVMFGSDQMVWPGVIERAIAVIEQAPFLGEAEKRDVLYHNAARFLRLGEEEIRRHHQR